ncbi:jg5688 [Pararge aegeria aegeria]|uniref:Jg5688 protein n=1 Tax=Pararge aegeria aegeria TaxID=348720 RepID=A0A8S4RKL7_9NEOP|nr:jg5688 [Pararge aegeria aegeria]
MATDLLRLRSPGDDSEFKNRTVTRRKRWPDACIWILLADILFVGCHGYQEQRFAMEPQDQSAILGSRVTLPCRVENKIGSLQWTKDDFGLGTHRNLSGYERYSMIGSDEEGDYSLDIRDVTLEDDGSYQCQVSSGLNGEPAIRSRYAQLTVLVAPDPPRILQGAFIDAIEKQPVDIECVSEGGKPAAEITWVDGNQVVITKNVESRVELLPDEQRYRTRSVLRLIPNKDHHNQTITCQAQNTADRAYRMATVHIEVKYAPKIKVSIKTATVNDKIPEGSEARIRCLVDANPLAQIYRWYLNGNPVVGDYTDEMIIFNVSRKHNKAVVKCEVSNSAGMNEASLTLNVTCAPKILSNRTQMGAEGDRVTVECEALSVPRPDDIRWFFEGREISAIHDPDYATVEESLPDGIVKSSLVIRASQSKHFGLYNCSVTNEYGNANAAIILKPLKSLPLFIILIGVTSGIIVFSGFVILLVMCHRRRRKKTQQMNEKPDVTVTTGDMYKESDRSSNISDLKLQLPHSDGSYDLEYTSSDRSDSKNPAGLPLAGPVPLPSIRHDDPMLQFRYSNDYSDPTYADTYFKGSLTRSIDTASTLPLSAGNGSQNNSLQRTNKPDETDAINNLGLPVSGEAPQAQGQVPVYAQTGPKNNSGVDLRYAATYGNPYLRNSSIGYNNQVHTAKPASTPAPPPYSAVRNSVALPGNGTQTTQATHV